MDYRKDKFTNDGLSQKYFIGVHEYCINILGIGDSFLIRHDEYLIFVLIFVIFIIFIIINNTDLSLNKNHHNNQVDYKKALIQSIFINK